jgi:hypothetical protein
MVSTFSVETTADPRIQATFVTILNGWAIHKPWTQVYDANERLFRGSSVSDGAPLIVDVGDQAGRNLGRVLELLSSLRPGALVLCKISLW